MNLAQALWVVCFPLPSLKVSHPNYPIIASTPIGELSIPLSRSGWKELKKEKEQLQWPYQLRLYHMNWTESLPH